MSCSTPRRRRSRQSDRGSYDWTFLPAGESDPGHAQQAALRAEQDNRIYLSAQTGCALSDCPDTEVLTGWAATLSHRGSRRPARSTSAGSVGVPAVGWEAVRQLTEMIGGQLPFASSRRRSQGDQDSVCLGFRRNQHAGENDR
jgi:hypothetical protein